MEHWAFYWTTRKQSCPSLNWGNYVTPFIAAANRGKTMCNVHDGVIKVLPALSRSYSAPPVKSVLLSVTFEAGPINTKNQNFKAKYLS